MLMGVNLAGAEFGATYPGTEGVDYAFPAASELDYYQSKGLTLIRLPFLWERMQPTLNGPLDSNYLDRVKTFVAEAAARGMQVVLDAHDYGRYGTGNFSEAANHGNVIGSAAVPYSAFRDFWTKMASQFAGNPGIYGYDIMNEPHDMGGANVWPTAAQDAVNGIRSVDKTTPIIVEGDGWATAANWPTVNANLHINDPSSKTIYEAHIYFDRNDSGNYVGTYDQEGAYPGIGVARLQPFVNWLNQNHYRGYVGEYSVPDNDRRWLTVLDNFLSALKADGLPGTYWAGGPLWGNSPGAVDPISGQDRPQMSILQKYPNTGWSSPSR
jgi:endoglucanase